MDNDLFHFQFSIFNFPGGLAQLARAPALQAGGQRFESVILHLVPSLSFFLCVRVVVFVL